MPARNFNELRAKMSPERRAKTEARVKAELELMERIAELEAALREVRQTWPVMQAAQDNPHARDWCEKVDRLLLSVT